MHDFDNFTFYNRYRNTSDWIDSSELTWFVMKKNDKNKKVQPTNYEKTVIKGSLKPWRRRLEM